MEYGEFENEISILLKKARELEVPAKYIFADKNLISDIKKLIPTGISLSKLYEKFPIINSKDLGLIYGYMTKKELSDDAIFKNINKFYVDQDISPLRDIAELNLFIKDFLERYKQDYERDMTKLDNLENLQEELSNYSPLPYTDIKVESIILFSTMKYKEKIPSITDGYEIFDTAIPDITIPFIKWKTDQVKTNNKELFKLYKGNLENKPDFTKIIPSSGLKEVSNSFIFSVWDGDLEKDNIRNATKESYQKGIYDLNTNIMKIKIPLDKGKTRILDRISKSLQLSTNDMSETSITGELFIYGVEFNDLLLSHMILNFELMNTYLFTKEMSPTYYEKKKQMKIFFRSANSFEDNESPSSVAFTIEQNYAKGGEVVTLDNKSTLKLNSNEPYLRVKIVSANSLKDAKSFVKIFSRLLRYYKKEEKELEKVYLHYIPEFKREESLDIIVRKSADTKIGRLKQVAPDLFVTDYARKCLCQFQPIPIPKDEIEAWRKKTFIYKGKVRERQILAFPPENPLWNFVCPEDNYPFPGVKANTLSNKDKYKGLPCCFVNNQMDEDANSKFNKLYRDKITKDEEEDEDDDEEIQEKEAETHLIKTDQIIKPGRYGQLPSSIENLLSSNKKYKEIRRKGIPRSYNSLLHCVSLAVNDRKYLDRNEEEREIYVANLRRSISNSTLPGLLKQEMYDFNDFEISTGLSNNYVFLDPDLYYRAIEEAYKINIFVFAPSNDENKRLKNKEESIGVLELPRFKLFHSRIPRPKRPTIIIYRTMGSETNNLLYPQCELIVAREEKDISVFDEDMYNNLFNTSLTVSKTISWELVSEGNQIDVLARENLYSRLNYYNLTNKTATKQYIDQYGKLRGLYIPVGKEEVLMLIPASSPENLPTFNSISRASSKTVFSIITNPTAVSSELSDIADGLWFPVLDLVYGIYIPIIPEKISLNKKLQNLPVGPSNPMGEKGIEVVPRTIKLKRDLDFIMQVIKWLYALSDLSLENFLNKYTNYGDINQDSSKIYDLNNIGREFPKVKTIEEGIVEMNKRIPSLFNSGRVFFYSEKFFNGIYYLMQMYIKEYEKASKIVPKAISRKYLTEQDFISHIGTALFFSEVDLKIWLSSSEKQSNIYKNINSSFALRSSPYIYEAPDSHIYLIQNVIEGQLSRALNIGYYWKTHKINIGFKSPEYDEIDEPKYVVYGITAANVIVPVENKAGESLSFYSVLQYNSFTYAAMLLLL